MTTYWFSAMTVFVVRIGANNAGWVQRNLYLIKGADFDEAKAAVITRARQDEQVYTNADGDPVRWMLAEVETLDCLGETLEDGREVYSEPREDLPISEFTEPFTPELSEPTYSGV
jgi:hypothetical protein